MSLERHGLWLSTLLCATAFAGPPAPAQAPTPALPTSAAVEADDELIEFLGTDDVGDATWWEILKKSALPGQDSPSAAQAQPQDAKQ